MEEYKNKTSHQVCIQNRSEGRITGVEEMNEFDSTCISMNTSMGCVVIQGQDLKVKRLNLEQGEADITGTIDSFSYTARKKGESVWKRMFQ